jgi:NAD(P)-dependent dehydrogenase (short-subunit alcohol dehydrogenase family)
MKLNGQRIVILGGSSGIGLAYSSGRGAGRASVVIASSRKARVDEALVTLPASAEGHALDLTDEQAVKAPVRNRHRRRAPLGRIYGRQIGSSGISGRAARLSSPRVSLERVTAGWGASICSAMEGLTRALAVELAPIRVNIVSPGVVKSPLWANMTAADREALYRQTAEKLP